MKLHGAILATGLSALLASCGGSDGGVASAPTPVPTPAPTGTPTTVTVREPLPSPITRPGSYDAIAAIQTLANGNITNERVSSGGDVTMVITAVPTGQDQVSYTLQFNATDIPATSSLHRFPDSCLNGLCVPLGWKYVVTDYAADGRVLRVADSSHPAGDSGSENQMPSGSAAAIAYYSVGLSHVTYGVWESDLSHFSDTPLQDGTRVIFVHGDRTSASEIPLSGTASYSAVLPDIVSKTPAGGIVNGLNFAFSADFASRSLSAQIFQEYATYIRDDGSNGAVPGINVSGTALFNSAGSFSIPLSGTLTLGYPGPATSAASGSLSGAFFGPGAAQIGGILSIGPTAGLPVITDAFLGSKN
jgi:hypothetical protein